MKTMLTIGWAGVVLAGASPVAVAGPRALEPAPIATALSGDEVRAGLRQMGLNPIGEPVLRGPYYLMHAYDPRGIEMRVLIDAQFGDVISVEPARPLNAVFAPPYVRAPRIIHIPPRGEREGDATSDTPERPAADDDGQAPKRSELQPKSKLKSKPRRRAEAAPDPHRAVLSAPSADTSLTPVLPTTRFDAPADKFAPPPAKDAP